MYYDKFCTYIENIKLKRNTITINSFRKVLKRKIVPGKFKEEGHQLFEKIDCALRTFSNEPNEVNKSLL